MLLKELVLVIPHRSLSSKSLLLSLVALDQVGKHTLMTTLMTNLKLHSQNLRRTRRRKRRMEKIKVCQWRAVSLMDWRVRVHQYWKKVLKLAFHCRPMMKGPLLVLQYKVWQPELQLHKRTHFPCRTITIIA